MIRSIKKANKCIKNGWSEISHWSDELRNNKELVIKAINLYPYDLQYASDSLKDDYDVVSIAVNKSAYSLMYASERLRNSEEFSDATKQICFL